jgi:hypothetical protein
MGIAKHIPSFSFISLPKHLLKHMEQYSHATEPENSLLHSQKPAIRPSSDSYEPNLQLHTQFKTHRNIILPSIPRFPCGLFPSDFPTKILNTFLISVIHATWLACLILTDLITLTIFGTKQRWNFQQPSVISSLLRPNNLLRTMFSETLNHCSPLTVTDKFHNQRKWSQWMYKQWRKVFII